MSAVPSKPAATPRHALGLPAGSVRALLALGVLALSWVIVLLKKPDEPLPAAFIYLQALMLLILASFFASHGRTIGPHVSPRSPLGLPRGSVRFLLLAGYAGLAYFVYHEGRDFAHPPRGDAAFVFLLLTGGFFLGHVISRCVQTLSGGVEPFWFQDIQAWVALLAMIAMAALTIIHVFINVSLPEPLNTQRLDEFLAAVVGFYFGSRS